MSESFPLYKLIVLYFLNRADGEVTAAAVTDFVLGKNYTDYFSIQQTISDLIASQLVATNETTNATLLSITADGRETLSYYEDKISEGIRKDISEYLSDNSIDIRFDTSVITECYKTIQGKYAARCQIKEGSYPVLDLTVTCNAKKQADIIAAQWKSKYNDVYALLMDELLS